jgi:hypothetical protein
MGRGADQPEGNRRGKWSADELTELGDLLLCEVSLQEIARLLGREFDDVQNAVFEEGESALTSFNDARRDAHTDRRGLGRSVAVRNPG